MSIRLAGAEAASMVLGLFFAVSSASAGQLDTVKVSIDPPCHAKPQKNIDLRQCSEVLQPDVLDTVQRNIETRLHCYYQHVDADFKKMADPAANPGAGCLGTDIAVSFIASNGTRSPVPVCNLADGERNQNHLVEPC